MNRSGTSVLIVAGEASADRYAARVVEELRRLAGPRRLRFAGAGGDRMRDAGVELLGHVRDLASIGPREAVAHMLKYLRLFRGLLRDAEAHPPAVALLLDFPDFNLRLAPRLKRAGIPVVYYISPQIWAWRRYRVRSIRRCVDRMLVILPFEEDFYREHDVPVEFVGHPLLEDFSPRRDRQEFLSRLGLDPQRETVALLPGSRRREAEYILPILVTAGAEILKHRPAQFLVSVAPTIACEHIRQVLQAVPGWAALEPHARLASAESRDILANADFAMVKSGTSTLEAALVGTPFLITYRISPASWIVGRILITSAFKGLVNLIAGERIVPELLQDEATPEALARTALRYLAGPEQAAAMKASLLQIRDRLGQRRASETVAAVLAGYIRQ